MQTKVNDQLAPLRETFHRNAPAIRPVISITAQLAGELKYAVGEARAIVLRWLQSRVGTLPAEAWAGNDFEHMAPGRFAAAVRVELPTGFYWALRCDDPDKSVPGRTWTTEVSIAVANGVATLGVRLVVSVLDGMPDYEPSIPSFVRQIANDPGMLRNGRPVRRDAMLVDSSAQLDNLLRLLVDPRRRNPVFLIAQDEASSRTSIDGNFLASKCLGTAHVVVLTSQQASELTRQVGKTLSVFNGAVRTYRAAFSFDDDPYRHPLAVAQQINSWNGIGPVAFATMLVQTAATNSIRLHDNPAEFPPFTKVKQVALQTRRTQPSPDLDFPALLALAEEELAEKQRDIEALESLLSELDSARSQQTDRVGELEAANAFLRSRVAQLDLPSEQVPLEDTYPTSYDAIGDWVDERLAGRLILAPRARRELKDVAFADTQLVCSCLNYLGREFWQMKVEGGGDLVARNEQKLANLGVKNEPSGAEHLLKEQGDTFFIVWGPQRRRRMLDLHLKNGGNTRDPSRCLRIYYFWDTDAQQVVVGSLPAHLNTRAS
jgi:hypothetical protein